MLQQNCRVSGGIGFSPFGPAIEDRVWYNHVKRTVETIRFHNIQRSFVKDVKRSDGLRIYLSDKSGYRKIHFPA